MDTDLRAVTAALARLTDSELRALIDATRGVPQTASDRNAVTGTLPPLHAIV